MNDNSIIKIFKERGIVMYMADLGASGENWEQYEDLKAISDVIRFDPDGRDIRIVKSGENRKVVTINKAVIENSNDTVEFFLTTSPYCSSTLEPDFEKLSKYAYADLFKIENVVSVPAITLDKAVGQAAFNELNWIKLDTQGTEFRILKSISSNLFKNIMFCDVEASLYRHYLNADAFPEIHDFMLENGFWFVNSLPHFGTRSKLETIQEITQTLGKRASKIYEGVKHKYFTTLEVTYLRTIESAKLNDYTYDQFLKLFLCHFYMEAFEYCIEILNDMEINFGVNQEIVQLKKETFFAINKNVSNYRIKYYFKAVKLRLKALVTSN